MKRELLLAILGKIQAFRHEIYTTDRGYINRVCTTYWFGGVAKFYV